VRPKRIYLLNIFVRGNNAASHGLPSGTNITGKISDIKIEANNVQTGQPEAVKTIPVNKPSTLTNNNP
jgi:hypothetical protein